MNRKASNLLVILLMLCALLLLGCGEDSKTTCDPCVRNVIDTIYVDSLAVFFGVWTGTVEFSINTDPTHEVFEEPLILEFRRVSPIDSVAIKATIDGFEYPAELQSLSDTNVSFALACAYSITWYFEDGVRSGIHISGTTRTNELTGTWSVSK